jgi:hypothetical protein
MGSVSCVFAAPLLTQNSLRFFASFALDHLAELRDTPDNPRSLFEGHAALAVLCGDLSNPLQSFMPGSEL